jgi:hypothetical protein
MNICFLGHIVYAIPFVPLFCKDVDFNENIFVEKHLKVKIIYHFHKF